MTRAITPAEKAIITGRLLAAWLKVPGLRLGQLIVNAVNNSSGADFPVFYAEDEELAVMVERFADAIERKD